MTTYRLLPQPQPYGYDLGILLLDQVETHLPGDTAHAGSYDYPVLFRVVAGATAARVLRGDPDLLPAVIEAARDLEAHGVRGIASNCGFMVNYQEAVSRAVDVPVLLSSLLQLGLINQALGGRPFGIATASLANLRRLKERFPDLVPDSAVLVGMGDTQLQRLFTPDFDPDQLRNWLLASARSLVESHGIRALLLECASLAPFTRQLQKALGIPVFDFISMIDLLHASICVRPSRLEP